MYQDDDDNGDDLLDADVEDEDAANAAAGIGKDGQDSRTSRARQQSGLFEYDPVYTTVDRSEGVRIDLQRTRTFERAHKMFAVRKRPRLENETWRGFRKIPMTDWLWKALPMYIKYAPIFIKEGDKRATGESWEKDILPPLGLWREEQKKQKDGTWETEKILDLIVHPVAPEGMELVWRPLDFWTPDANPTRHDSRQFDGFGLIPKDEVEALVDKRAKAEGLDQFENTPYGQIPKNTLWRLRQLYAEARLDVYFGPLVNPRGDPRGPRDWRKGYVNFDNAYKRFRRYVDEKKKLGWPDSEIYLNDNTFEEFYQLVYSEWKLVWSLIQRLAGEENCDPDTGLQDPWQSTKASEDIADIFSIRPPAIVTEIHDAEGKLIRVEVDRQGSIYCTKYDAETIGKWVEGNNNALAVYQNSDEAQVQKGAHIEARNKWLGGASYIQLIRHQRARLSYDVRVFNGEPLVREMIGGEPDADEYVGSDDPRVTESQVILPPFTEIWSKYVKSQEDLSASKAAIDEIIERLIKNDPKKRSEIKTKYGGVLIKWQKMVWVWEDSHGHWTGTPPNPDNFAEGLVMVFPGENWATWLDYLGTAGSEHFNYRTWHCRLQSNMARAGITDDLYAVNYSNAFNHEEISIALWLYQSAESLDETLESIEEDAQINRQTDYLEDVLRATEDLPTIEHGREDMESVIWRRRSEAFEWLLRRKAELYFLHFARVADIKQPFSRGFPWRLGNDTLSWKLLGNHGLHSFKTGVYNALQGLGEAQDDPRTLMMTPKINEFRVGGFLSRRFSFFFWFGKRPPEDGHTAHAQRIDIMDWLETWAGIPKPDEKEWKNRRDTEPAGFTGWLSEWIRIGVDWGEIEGVLTIHGFTPSQIRRVWYAYAPINDTPLD